MRSARLLPLLVVPVLMGNLSMCQGPLNVRKLSRPGPLNEEMAYDINPSKEASKGFVRQVSVPGKGTLNVVSKAANNKAEIELAVIPVEGESGSPLAVGGSPLEVAPVDAGEYYIAVRVMNGVKTKGKLTIDFKPDDPEAASGADGREQTAAKLQAGGRASGNVDYNSMDATDHLAIVLAEGGRLVVKPTLTPKRGVATLELKTPKDPWAPLDAGGPTEIKEAVAGTYIVKVKASEGASVDYVLETEFEAGDPCGAGGEDCTADGANEMTLKAKPGGSTQVAVAKDGVDFDKRDARDWYKVTMPDKGKFSVILKPKDRTAKVYAEWVTNEDDDDGQRIKTGFNVDVEKKSYWIKVFAAEKGAATTYVLEVEYYPNNYVQAKVVEIDKKSGCVVIVDKGTNHGVRPGVNADVMLNGAVVASGFVDQAFPLVTRVRLTTNECSFKPGTPVQIQGM